MLALRVRPRTQATTCAYCHSGLPVRVHECERCGTCCHLECRRALGRCPTLGCRVETYVRVQVPWRLTIVDFAMAAAVIALGLLTIGR